MAALEILFLIGMVIVVVSAVVGLAVNVRRLSLLSKDKDNE
jgi:hypothetical protein